jgi:hypothetical protein
MFMGGSQEMRLRLDSAGPAITSPIAVKREPWQGQSQVFSASFHATIQPICGQIGESSVRLPCSSQ